jgi:2-polyprenyl-6-hydroxyphenyl methylase/3-demethylubiquinone-9 3-methyltransferase
MLDVGCGGGLISEPLARLGGAVTGIDPASENIEVARAHAEGQGLEISYRAERLEDLVAAGAAFDVVVCLEVLEHVPAPQDFVGLLARVLKPGGLLVLSTINRTAAAYALAVVGAERVLGWLPAGTHQWDRFITPDELAGYCRAAALAPSPGRGLVYDVMQGEWRLGDDPAINYLISATRSAG